MTAISSSTSSGNKPSFREETMRVVIPLRSAVVDLMKHHPLPIARSRDVQEQFGLNSKLSWQVYRLLHATDTMELCMDIPPHGAMRNFLQTAEKQIPQAPRENITAVQSAYEAFEQHVERYAGDRNRFDTMIARLLGGSADGQIELAHRRAVFEAYRYMMGIEIGAVLNATIMYPSAIEGHSASLAEIRVRRHVWRLSADAPLIVDKFRVSHASNATTGSTRKTRPIDEKAFQKHGISILPRFCSTTDLPLKHTVDDEGIRTTEWLKEGVGQCEAIDLAMGDIHELARSPSVDPRYHSRLIHAETPAQLLLWDCLVHRPTFGKVEATLIRNSPAPSASSRHAMSQTNQPPMPTFVEKVSYLGSGAGAAYTSEVPRYAELLRYVCDSQGWALDELDVYRARIEYPLMLVSMMGNFQLERA